MHGKGEFIAMKAVIFLTFTPHWEERVIAEALFLISLFSSLNVSCFLPITDLHEVEGSAKRRSPGLVNFVSALSSRFCLTLPAAFMEPGVCLIAEPCTRERGVWPKSRWELRSSQKYSCCALGQKANERKRKHYQRNMENYV